MIAPVLCWLLVLVTDTVENTTLTSHTTPASITAHRFQSQQLLRPRPTPQPVRTVAQAPLSSPTKTAEPPSQRLLEPTPRELTEVKEAAGHTNPAPAQEVPQDLTPTPAHQRAHHPNPAQALQLKAHHPNQALHQALHRAQAHHHHPTPAHQALQPKEVTPRPPPPRPLKPFLVGASTPGP